MGRRRRRSAGGSPGAPAHRPWGSASGRCAGGRCSSPSSATAALIGALAWLDLTRDTADRSHLGRLFERIGSDGASGLTTVVERKLTVNLRSLTESTWRYRVRCRSPSRSALVVWRGRARAAAVAEAFPPLRRALPGLIVLAVLGYGANDSGIAVPAAMLAMAVPGFVYLACRVDPAEGPT